MLYVNARVTKHPGLVLVAQSTDDVVKGVHFARKFHLLLSVRGANALTYDYTGRYGFPFGTIVRCGFCRRTDSHLRTHAL